MTVVRKVGSAPNHPTTAHVPPFLGAGKGVARKLDGVSVTMVNAGPEVTRAATTLTTINIVTKAVTYKMTPAALKAELADPKKLAKLGFDALFRVSDSNSWGVGESATLTPVARADAFKTLWKIVSDHSNFEPPKSKTGAPMPGLTPVDDKKKFEAATRTLVQSLLHEPGFTQLYSAHWDNSDDTSFDGLIAINPTTGQIRTISVDMPA